MIKFNYEISISPYEILEDLTDEDLIDELEERNYIVSTKDIIGFELDELHILKDVLTELNSSDIEIQRLRTKIFEILRDYNKK